MTDSVLLTADTVATGSELLRPGWIEVRGPEILGVGAGAPPSHGRVRELGNVVVTPGFVDTHVHGGGGGSFTSAAEVGPVADFHARHGTTTLLASLVSAPPDELLRQTAALAELVADGVIAGIHLEGPWLSTHRCGAHDPAALRDPESGELDRLLAAGAGAIRMVTLAPERPGALSAVARIVAEGAVAAVGHTEATYEQTRAAIDVGATVGTHLFNAMAPVHHREPGPVLALLEDPRVTVELIADRVHLHPSLYRQVAGLVGINRVSLVTDAMAAAGMPDGDYRLGSLPVRVDAGVARVAGTETIAGSTATMDRVFANAVADGGPGGDAELLAAVRAACVNPARALGLSPRGLVAGAGADLVVLDTDLVVSAVMRDGRWLPVD